MELKWLEDFLALCAAGNFRVAAKKRCVSQPAFSRRIQSLEAWVETTLVDRSHKPTQLTDAGKVFKPMAENLVKLSYLARTEIQEKTEEKERIRFATLGTLAQAFMPAWLKTLKPFIDANQFMVKTDYDTIADYFEALEDNSVDFFVCYEDIKIRFQDDSTIFTSLKLGEESLVPVNSPNADGAPRWWLPDMPKEPIPCLHTLSKLSPWSIRNHMQSKYGNLTFESVYESSVGPTLREMAIEGFGMAWIPSTLVRGDLANGRLVRAAEQKDDIVVDIKIFRCADCHEPRVEKFWQVLLQQNQSVNVRS